MDDENKNYLKDLSIELSNMFVNTNVNCFLISGKTNSMQVFGVPSMVKYSYGSLFKYENIISNKKFYGVLSTIEGVLSGTFTLPLHVFDGNVDFNNNSPNNKIKLNINEANVFIGDTILNKLTHEELIAISLHAIGFSTRFFSNYFNHLLKASLFGVHVSSLVNVLRIMRENDFILMHAIVKILISTIAFAFVGKHIYKLNRKLLQEGALNDDVFVVNMGYGKHLITALEKLYSILDTDKYICNIKNELIKFRKKYNIPFTKEDDKIINSKTFIDVHNMRSNNFDDELYDNLSMVHLPHFRRKKFIEKKMNEIENNL